MQTTESFTSYAGAEHVCLPDVDCSLCSVFKCNFDETKHLISQHLFVKDDLVGPDAHLPLRAQTLHSVSADTHINT